MLNPGLDGAPLKAFIHRTVFLTWRILALVDGFASKADQFFV